MGFLIFDNWETGPEQTGVDNVKDFSVIFLYRSLSIPLFTQPYDKRYNKLSAIIA